MRRYSLRWRLTIALFVVAFAAVLIVAILAASATSRQFSTYVERGPSLMIRRVMMDAARTYVEEGGWKDPEDTARRLGQDFNVRVVILDRNGMTLADSDPDSAAPVMRRSVVLEGEGLVGYLLVGPPRPGAEERLFLDTIYRWLIIGAVLAGGLALGAGLLVSRRLTAPLKDLTDATRKMAAGDHTTRVEATGKDELGELGVAFNEMASSVELSETLRRRLIGDVAHELRTPLARLGGRLEGLRDGVLPADDTTLGSLTDEVLVLSGLVGDLQELSLAESGALKYGMRRIDLADVVSEEAERFRIALESKGVALEVTCPSGSFVCGDPARIGQVVRNLVDNAVKHTDAGSVTVTCEGGQGGAVAMQVSDTGPGIGAEELPFVFERFYRADASRERRRGGTGIGLTIARRIVEDHGGTIEADSAEGSGTTLRVVLPAPEGECGDNVERADSA